MDDTSTVEPAVEIERRVEQLLASFPPDTTDMTTFLGAQFDAGLAWGGCSTRPRTARARRHSSPTAIDRGFHESMVAHLDDEQKVAELVLI